MFKDVCAAAFVSKFCYFLKDNIIKVLALCNGPYEQLFPLLA